MNKSPALSAFRFIAILSLLVGATASVFLTLHAGRKNNSILLPALFLFWVLSPYAALLIADAKLRAYQAAGQVVLYLLMMLLSAGSLIGYSGFLSPISAKPAAIFLIVPLVSWGLIIGVIATIAIIERRRKK